MDKHLYRTRAQGFTVQYSRAKTIQLRIGELWDLDREFILNEIRRIATANGGKAPGRDTFRQVTGIRHHQWLGVYWASWGAAVSEAGFEPNTMDAAFNRDLLLHNLASAVRDMRKFPTVAELALHARGREGFPPGKAFQRHFKTKALMASALSNYCQRVGGLSDVLEICRPYLETKERPEKISKPLIKGHVYLMRSGKYYKIGKSNHVGRREYQIGLLLPEPVNTVHSIATDDPDGIEAYWHNRFKSKRAEGEWFSLGQDDIKALKARRFMLGPVVCAASN